LDGVSVMVGVLVGVLVGSAFEMVTDASQPPTKLKVMV
jgi:hypothetical protein